MAIAVFPAMTTTSQGCQETVDNSPTTQASTEEKQEEDARDHADDDARDRSAAEPAAAARGGDSDHSRPVCSHGGDKAHGRRRRPGFGDGGKAVACSAYWGRRGRGRRRGLRLICPRLRHRLRRSDPPSRCRRAPDHALAVDTDRRGVAAVAAARRLAVHRLAGVRGRGPGNLAAPYRGDCRNVRIGRDIRRGVVLPFIASPACPAV